MVVFGEFEWDATKAATNTRKHGVRFEEAVAVFADPSALYEEDDDPDRVRTIGLSADGRVLLVVSTERLARTRIISARRAEPDEQARYFDSP